MKDFSLYPFLLQNKEYIFAEKEKCLCTVTSCGKILSFLKKKFIRKSARFIV